MPHLLVFFVAALFTAAACDGGSTGPTTSDDDNACAGISCPGGGTCVIENNAPVCKCISDTLGVAVDCSTLEDNDGSTDGPGTDNGPGPCDGVDCSGHGVCGVVDGAGLCNCDPGFSPVGTSCVSNANPCANVSCCNRGQCQVDGNQLPFCSCNAGYDTLNDALTCDVDGTGTWPPKIGTLFDGECALPTCDQNADPGFWPDGKWQRTLTTTFSDCPEIVQLLQPHGNLRQC